MFAEGKHREKLDVVLRKNICLVKSCSGQAAREQVGFLLLNRHLWMARTAPHTQLMSRDFPLLKYHFPGLKDAEVLSALP